MKSTLSITLHPSAEQQARLQELQQAFAQVCNEIAPMVQQTSCWNRVALHHMAYRTLRQRFPGLGSQMVCNAIYSVSRACRIVYQHPASPFNTQRLAGKPLPRVIFKPQSPVYFDRHTLSLKDGVVSMFTLDGRMRFRLALAPHDEARFREAKLREIVLSRPSGRFVLTFRFADGATSAGSGMPEDAAELPEYVVVMDDAAESEPAHRRAAPTPASHEKNVANHATHRTPARA